MKKPKITFKVDLDFKNPEVKEWFEKKSKVKKLEDITLDEIFTECPVKPIIKSCQLIGNKSQRARVHSLIKKWRNSFEITYNEIADILIKPRGKEKINISRTSIDKETTVNLIGEIANIFKNTYKPMVPWIDILEKASKEAFIDERKKKTYPEIESLEAKLQDETFRQDRKEIENIINNLRKLEAKPKTMKRQDMKEMFSKHHPFLSATEMINYQSMKLFNCIRKYISGDDMNDQIVDSIISDLLNKIYEAEFDFKMVKEFRRNARQNPFIDS